MHKKLKILLFIIFVVNIGLWPAGVCAEETGKFNFYYQQIEKVVQVEPATEPKTPWEKVGRFFQKGTNVVRKYFDKVVRRNFFPGEGSTLWFSEKNPKIAYQVKRVKVTDEKHLLKLMGAKNGNETSLNDGQKALLGIYRNARNPALSELSKKSLAPRIIVHLSDTTGFEDGSKYPEVTTDFWPQSMYLSITMPSKRYAYPNSQEDALATFVHETGHCTNLTIPELRKPYGLDGVHYADEVTKKRMAFQEGWSDYQEALFSPKERKNLESGSKRIKIEDLKTPGKYAYYDVTDPSVKGSDLFRVEAINAMILYRISQEIPDGRKKVTDAFFHGNMPWRSMTGFLKGFAKRYPQDSAKLAQIVDDMTAHKFSGKEIQDLTGSVPQKPASIAESPKSDSAKTSAIPAMQEGYQSAYRSFVEAAKAGDARLIKKAKEQLDKARAGLNGLK